MVALADPYDQPNYPYQQGDQPTRTSTPAVPSDFPPAQQPQPWCACPPPPPEPQQYYEDYDGSPYP
jgi:hypothetical protein